MEWLNDYFYYIFEKVSKKNESKHVENTLFWSCNLFQAKQKKIEKK